MPNTNPGFYANETFPVTPSHGSGGTPNYGSRGGAFISVSQSGEAAAAAAAENYLGVDLSNPINYPFTYTQSRPSYKESGSDYNSGSYNTGASGKRESNASPSNEPLPLVYGRTKIPASFVYLKVLNNVLYAVYVLCEGQINKVDTVYLNDKPTSGYSGVILEKYLGKSGAATSGNWCQSLKTADPNWSDYLAGTAYLYLKIPQSDDIQDLPMVEAIVEGKLVYDPRTPSSSGTGLYSTNPALHVADLLTNRRYGAGIRSDDIDWDSVIDAANYCDELVGSQKRYEFNYAFTGQGDVGSVREVILRHFLGAVRFRGGKFRIDVAKLRDSSATFTDNEIYEFKTIKIPSGEFYNLIEWTWTDPTTWESISESIEDPNIVINNEEIHDASYDLTGCLTLSQSRRIATYLLNSRLSDLHVSFRTHNHKGLEALDTFTLTHSLGVSSKLFSVIQVSQEFDGSYTITAREYDPAFFSSAVMTEPTFPDTTLPDPSTVPSEASWRGDGLYEDLYMLKDSTWFSTLRMEWNHSEFHFKDYYEIWVSVDGGAYTLQDTTRGDKYEMSPVDEGKNYSVKIVTVSYWKVKSPGIIDNYTVQGKYIKPTWKASAQSYFTAVESGDKVILKWSMSDGSTVASDVDLTGYLLYRGRAADNDPLKGTFVNFISGRDTISYVDSTAPAGTWRYYLIAKDSVGNTTETFLYADVAVTLNPYLGYKKEQDSEIWRGSPTSGCTSGFVSRVLQADSTYKDYFYPSHQWTWNQYSGSTWSAEGDNLWIFPCPTSGAVMSDVTDMGSIISGNYQLFYVPVSSGAGAAMNPYVYISLNGTDYTKVDALSSFNTQCRYFKTAFEFTQPTSATYWVGDRIYVYVSADPKMESGELYIGSDLGTTLTFENSFMAIESVQVTVLSANARIVTVDDLTVSGCVIKVFDAAGAGVAGDTVKYIITGY